MEKGRRGGAREEGSEQDADEPRSGVRARLADLKAAARVVTNAAGELYFDWRNPGTRPRPVAGRPFVRGKGDAHDIDPDDVEQGTVGDCWLMAGLASVARANPEAIRRLIRDNRDGTYAVTLHVRDRRGRKHTEVVQVRRRFEAKDGELAHARPGDRYAGGVELWTMLIEQAVARQRGSYGLLNGGKADTGLNYLTAGDSSVHRTAGASPDHVLSAVGRGLAEHRPITATTLDLGGQREHPLHFGPPPIFANHAYSIAAVDRGARTIAVQDPNLVETLSYPVPIVVFMKCFKDYCLGPRL